jgi:hypothetical protein
LRSQVRPLVDISKFVFFGREWLGLQGFDRFITWVSLKMGHI